MGRMMRGIRTGRLVPRAQRGQTLVEFSLVVPLLLLLIFGIIEFALAMHTTIDFGSATSEGIREATVLGSGAALGEKTPPQNQADVDPIVSQHILQGLRGDDLAKINYYSIACVSPRTSSDASTLSVLDCGANTYRNFYLWKTSLNSPDPNAYAYFLARANHTDWPLPGGGVPSACSYYYGAHTDTTTTPAMSDYLGPGTGMRLSGTLSSDDPPVVDPRNYPPIAGVTTTPPASIADPLWPQLWRDTSGHLCGRVQTSPQSCPQLPAVSPALCYYYPPQRMDYISTAALSDPLPDLVQIELSFTYHPVISYIAAFTPLGKGFTIVDHAQGRIEPRQIL